MSLEAHHRFIIDTMNRHVDIAHRMIADLEAENARLKAEVERLRASSFVTAVPVEQYERVVKAGDWMADEMLQEYGRKECLKIGSFNAWQAAKEGKPSV